jgi:hypothetical protein
VLRRVIRANRSTINAIPNVIPNDTLANVIADNTIANIRANKEANKKANKEANRVHVLHPRLRMPDWVQVSGWSILVLNNSSQPSDGKWGPN